MSQDPVHSNMDKKDFIQRSASEAVDQVHWTQQQPLRCDPAAWLNSETLLPRLTVENLSKWTLYSEQNLAKSPRATALRERWEAEDVTEDILEMDLAQKQVSVLCSSHRYKKTLCRNVVEFVLHSSYPCLCCMPSRSTKMKVAAWNWRRLRTFQGWSK